MKIFTTVALATVFAATAFTAFTASADGLSGLPIDSLVTAPTMENAMSSVDFVGAASYEFEQEMFDTTLGVQYTTAKWVFQGTVSGSDVAGNFDFTGADVTAVYGVNMNVDVYGRVSTDADWNHDATEVGVAFRF